MSIKNVRNFWIECQVDGKVKNLASGPASKGGGIRIKILQRDEGRVTNALSITGLAQENGTLKLIVDDGKGKEVYTSMSKR